MASPMVDGRVEPHRKATYTLDVGEQMRNENRGDGFSSVKYNHKPVLASGTRSTTLQPATENTYNLSLHDTNTHGDKDMFVFNGTRIAPTKSYVLLFDPTTQKATLERLDSTYTFNLATHNGTDVSAQHNTLYPRKLHKDADPDRAAAADDLFGDTHERGDEGLQPEQDNPYDFRHFLHAVEERTRDVGEAGYASSPDARSTPTPVPAAALPARRALEPLPKKRKAASVFAKKPAAKGGAKKKDGVPSVNLGGRPSVVSTAASTSAKSTAGVKPKPKANTTSTSKPSAPAPASSKIKSAEFVAESDESDVDMDVDNDNDNDNDNDMDIDAEGEPDSTLASPHPPTHTHHTTSPGQRPSPSRSSEQDNASSSDAGGENPAEEDDDDDDDDDDGGLEIEVPDAHPAHRRPAHLGMSSSLHRGARSPSHGHANTNGPISLASAASSVQNTPRRGAGDVQEEIDFGDLDGPDEGEGRKSGNAGAGAHAAKADEVDEDDPLYMEMMEGLAGGESSEESEEE